MFTDAKEESKVKTKNSYLNLRAVIFVSLENLIILFLCKTFSQNYHTASFYVVIYYLLNEIKYQPVTNQWTPSNLNASVYFQQRESTWPLPQSWGKPHVFNLLLRIVNCFFLY